LLVQLNKMSKRKKLFSLIIVAEGNENGNAQELADIVSKRFKEYETKVTIIGHLQRGGSPTALDRLLASRMGFSAVEGMIKGKRNVMVGVQKNIVTYVPLSEATSHKKSPDQELIRMAEILSL